jgi:hypothetical protein
MVSRPHEGRLFPFLRWLRRPTLRCTPVIVIAGEIDVLTSTSYVLDMFVRVLAMLAVLAIVALTTLAPAHAARMSAGSNPAVHASEMMHAAVYGEHACAEHHGCGEADAGLCEFVCAGLTALPAMPGAEIGQAYVSPRRSFPSEESLASQSPDLNERPPKTRLL